MTKETVSRIEASLVLTAKGWQANVRKDGESGYSVFIASTPALAIFGALSNAGLTDGQSWVHPDPFVRLNNALDRAIIALGSDE